MESEEDINKIEGDKKENLKSDNSEEKEEPEKLEIKEEYLERQPIEIIKIKKENKMENLNKTGNISKV